jgi:putative spermidine/putrescine transport system permease protein
MLLSRVSFALFVTPLFVPAIVLGIGLSRITGVFQLPDSLSVALSLSVVSTPLFMICTVVAMQGVDVQLKNAAASLGASGLSTFFLVTMPLIRRGLVIGTFIAFLVSIDELVITVFVAPPGIQTLPIKFWSALRFYTSPLIAPVSTVMLLVMLVVLTFAFFYGARHEESESAK